MGYRTIEEIKAANITARLHFFAPGLMRLRDTRVYPEVYLGRFFITSERNVMLAQSPRGFSIREVLPDTSIKLVGRFQQFQTLQEAKNAILPSAGTGSAGYEGDRLTTTPRSPGRSSIAGPRRPAIEDTGSEKLDADAIERLRELKRNRTSLRAPRDSGSGPGEGQIAEPAGRNTLLQTPDDDWQVGLDRQLEELGAPTPTERTERLSQVARRWSRLTKNYQMAPPATSQVRAARKDQPYLGGGAQARRGKPTGSQGSHGVRVAKI